MLVELGSELILLFVCLTDWRPLLIAGIAVVDWFSGGSVGTDLLNAVSLGLITSFISL